MTGDNNLPAKASTSKSSANKQPSSSSSSSNSGSGGLHSFLQNNAAKQQQQQEGAKVDWENMSRGAYSTVSKMKSAVERMNHKKTAPLGAEQSQQQQQHRPRKTKSSQEDRLGSFFQKAKANTALPISSDDRSRGAHSTMSHNVRRVRKQQQQHSKQLVPAAEAHVAYHPSPTKKGPPQAAERKLPTGNPKSASALSSSSSNNNNNNKNHHHHHRRQKNLELFMSRQAPLPPQDLEVRSAFTSVDQARKYTMKTVPVAPLPTSKEELLHLLRTTTTTTTTSTADAAAVVRPPKGGGGGGQRSLSTMHASTSNLASLPPGMSLLDTSTSNSTNASPSGAVKKNVRSKSSDQLLSSMLTPNRGVGRSTSASSNNNNKSPKRGVGRTTSGSSTRSYNNNNNNNKKRQPRSHPKQQQQQRSSSTERTFRTTSAMSPTQKFSNTLPAINKVLLDKPQPIVPDLSDDEASLMRSQSVHETSSSYTAGQNKNHHGFVSSVEAMINAQTTGVATSSSKTQNNKGLAKTLHGGGDGGGSAATTTRPRRAKDSAASLDGGSVPRMVRKKQKSNSAMTDDAKKKSNNNNNNTNTKTSSKVMSARRLHHAPANSIPSSPIVGRRQSVKSGLAGTATGEGKKVNKQHACSSNPKKRKPVAGGKKARPQQQQQQQPQRPLRLPMTPDIDRTSDNPGPAHEGGGGSKQPLQSTRHLRGKGPPSTTTTTTTTIQRRKPATTTEDEPGRKSGSIARRRNHHGGNGSTEASSATALLDDIFSLYTWSAPRQPAHKILEERQVMRNAVIMDGGPLHRAYNRIVAAQ